MENVNISLNNNLIPYSHYNTTNFYTSDKFIYIIFDKVPDYDLIGKFTNILNKDSVEFTIESASLQDKFKELNIPYCTIPIVSLYKPGLINSWKLTILNAYNSEIICQFQINIRIISNNKIGKPDFMEETFCGIFIDRKA